MINGEKGTLIKGVHLPPGEVYSTSRNEAITTILGSCVACCLLDPVLKIGGMNHIVLPYSPDPNQFNTRFGDIAMPFLLSKVKRLGAEVSRLQAFLYGGAGGLLGRTMSFNVGQQNIEVAELYLKKHGIPVRARDVGGSRGRKIVFAPHLGEIKLTVLQGFDESK